MLKILQVPGQHLPGCHLTRSPLLQAEGVHPSASLAGGKHGSLPVASSCGILFATRCNPSEIEVHWLILPPVWFIAAILHSFPPRWSSNCCGAFTSYNVCAILCYCRIMQHSETLMAGQWLTFAFIHVSIFIRVVILDLGLCHCPTSSVITAWGFLFMLRM